MASNSERGPTPGSDIESLPEAYIENLGEYVESDKYLNCAIGREKIHETDSRTTRLHSNMENACSNNAFVDYIMRSIFRKDEELPQTDKKERVTKKIKSKKPPQGLEVSNDTRLNPKWVSVFDLVNSTERGTDDNKKMMLKKAMDLNYKDHVNSLGMIFSLRGTQYQPDRVFGICDKMRLREKVNDSNDSNAVTIAKALLKATFCKGPKPEDTFVFHKETFTSVCIFGKSKR